MFAMGGVKGCVSELLRHSRTSFNKLHEPEGSMKQDPSTLLGPHRRRPDSPPAGASEFLPGHHGPIARCGIHNYSPENPPRRSVPGSRTSPSGLLDPLWSEFPVASAFRSLSPSKPGAPVLACTFSASAIARFHPEIVLFRLRLSRSSPSRRR